MPQPPGSAPQRHLRAQLQPLQQIHLKAGVYPLQKMPSCTGRWQADAPAPPGFSPNGTLGSGQAPLFESFYCRNLKCKVTAMEEERALMRGLEQLLRTGPSPRSNPSLSLLCHGLLGSGELPIFNLPATTKIMFQTTPCYDPFDTSY